MLEKVTTIEEGVRKLFTVRKQTIPHFTLTSRQQGEYTDILEWNGRRIPLLDSHFDMLIQIYRSMEAMRHKIVHCMYILLEEIILHFHNLFTRK